MKWIINFLLLTSVVFASNINDSVLKVHATLLPKIYLMEYNFQNKLIDDTIKISLVYKAKDYKSAQSLKSKILSRYKKGIKSYKIAVTLLQYHDLKNQKSNIFYLFPASDKEIEYAVAMAKRSNALTFSYLSNDLNNGVMISLTIGKTVKPILNLNAIKANDINLRPVLINISTIFVKAIPKKELILYQNRQLWLCEL